jgi:hypothetical protein
MFGQGQECYVSSRPDQVPVGSARLTEKNSLRLQEGAKIRIVVSSKPVYLTVIKLAACALDKDKDNITIGDAMGGDTGGFYKKVSARTFAWHKAWGTRKARWSGKATIVSMISAAGASVYASMKDCHGGLGCVKPVTWVLIGLSALASALSWIKDNDVF